MIPGLYTLPELQRAIATHPSQWRPLVFTNGCFDLIHAGHVRYLRQAKAMGRSLIVGLNSDRSVQVIKPATTCGISRPIVPQAQRAEVLGALKPVDGVVLFAETVATGLIEALQPDIYVKGGDYQLASLPEAAAVYRYGGQVVLIPIEVFSSTTAIVERIVEGIQSSTATFPSG